MYYTIYKITNQINGKVYIGSHKTKNLDDNYMGSGKYLKRAQEKHGIENFSKEILFVFNTPELMYAKEAEIVNEEFLTEENTYNIKIGGYGGWDFNNTTEGQKLREYSYEPWRESGTNSFIKKFNEDFDFREKRINHMIDISKKGSKAIKEKYPEGSFKGKKHSDESKRKMSSSSIGKNLGHNNSQFGTMWITDGISNKKVKKNDEIPLGWNKGRKIK